MGLLVLFIVVLALISLKTPTTDSMSSSVTLPVPSFKVNPLKYAIMIDAGSSGSRVQIYVWSSQSRNSREPLKISFLKDKLTGGDVFMKITPGLSSMSSKPSFASNYIEPLLDFAAKHVPEQEHSSTSLYILATAGMRMLAKDTQDKILEDLRQDIPKKYKFYFEPSNFAVITGKEEGIYSWIALNDLTHKLEVKVPPVKPVTIHLEGKKIVTRERTIGMLEMGGASTQIAFEVTSKRDLDLLKRRQGLSSIDELKDVLIEVNLASDPEDGEKTYLLYVKTFLGLGANEARDRYWKQLLKNYLNSLNASTMASPVGQHPLLSDPCMNPSVRETKTFVIQPKLNQMMNDSIKLDIQGTGNYTECNIRLKEMLDGKKEDMAVCSVRISDCPVTDLSKTRVSFEGTEFYGFSEFFYSTDDVYHLGGKYDYEKVLEATKKHCSFGWYSMPSHYDIKSYPRADEQRLRTQCFKGSYMMSFLHEGLSMPKTYSAFTTVHEIEGNIAQWTLGALILMKSAASRKSHPQEFVSDFQIKKSTSSFMIHLLVFICIIVVIVFTVIYLRLHRFFPLNGKKRRKDSSLSSEDQVPLWTEEEAC